MSRVLLVEDLRRGCPVHLRAMRAAGYTVESAHTLAGALRRLGPAGQRERFDAIVLDLRDSEALAGLEALKARASGAAILGLAGLGALSRAARSPARPDALVSRPVDEGRLLQALGELLRGEAVAERMARALRRAATSEAHAAALEGMARKIQAGGTPEEVLGAAVRPYLDAEAFSSVALLHPTEGGWRVLVEAGPPLVAPLMAAPGTSDPIRDLLDRTAPHAPVAPPGSGLGALLARPLDGDDGAVALAASPDPAFVDEGDELLRAACAPWLVALRLARSVADLSASEDRFHSLADALPRGLLVVDDRGRVSYANPLATALLGADARGAALESLLPELQAGELAVRGGRSLELGVRGYPDRLGRRHTTVLITDVTERHRAAHALRDAALRDDLTGLLNRRGLEAAARALTDPVALLVLDLDGFKEVNDRGGHASGDALLRAVGTELRHAFRASDLVARWGGDEFLVLVQADEDADLRALVVAAEAAVERAAEALGLGTRASVGVARGLAQGDGLAGLFERADAAMYAVKHERSGRGRGPPAPEPGA